MHPIDPVNLDPIPPLIDSYIYHSEPYLAGPSSASINGDATSVVKEEDGWIMGIDEAGRGPVLGPMVYAAAYCPKSFKPELESMGFDDSKALSPEVRQTLWNAFSLNPPLCYSSVTLSPQSISSGMLRRSPINLNRQAEEATISLIQSALDRRIPLVECYVDALGPAPQWEARLGHIFPSVKFTVRPKADSLFKIVGASSIIAKVTRDRYIEEWRDIEDIGSGNKGEEGETVVRGSGYPSDPKTQAYLKDSVDQVFGYKGIVRFSWATVRVILEKRGVEAKWIDENAQPSAASYLGVGADNGRPKVWRDLGVTGAGEL